MLVSALNAVDSGFFGSVVVVRSTEMIPTVLLRRVTFSSSVKVGTEPAFNLKTRQRWCCSVPEVDLDNHAFLRAVNCCFVV